MKKIKHIVFDHDGTLVDVNRTRGLFEGVEDLLESLESKEVKLYVWTARTRYSTVEFLKSLGIINRFEQLRCSTDGDPKPCVEGLSAMLDGAAPETVLVVGDSFADMVGAKKYGALALGAAWDGDAGKERERHKEMLKEWGADFLAETVSDCKDQIMALLKARK